MISLFIHSLVFYKRNCYIMNAVNESNFLCLHYRLPVPLPGAGPLQEVQVPVISQSSCQQMYQTDPTEKVDILQDMLCAGFQEGGKDSCQVRLNHSFLILCTAKAAWSRSPLRALWHLPVVNAERVPCVLPRGTRVVLSSARWSTAPGYRQGWSVSDWAALTGTSRACTHEWPASPASLQARYLNSGCLVEPISCGLGGLRCCFAACPLYWPCFCNKDLSSETCQGGLSARLTQMKEQFVSDWSCRWKIYSIYT